MKDRVATVRAVRFKDHVNYALLMGPGLFIYSAIVIFPIFFSLYFSLTQWSGFGAPVFVGLGNYREMFSDPVFLFSIRNNTLIILMSIFGQLPIGFCLAYAIFRKMINGALFCGIKFSLQEACLPRSCAFLPRIPLTWWPPLKIESWRSYRYCS